MFLWVIANLPQKANEIKKSVHCNNKLKKSSSSEVSRGVKFFGFFGIKFFSHIFKGFAKTQKRFEFRKVKNLMNCLPKFTLSSV